jgi:hypothetical protein
VGTLNPRIYNGNSIQQKYIMRIKIVSKKFVIFKYMMATKAHRAESSLRS